MTKFQNFPNITAAPNMPAGIILRIAIYYEEKRINGITGKYKIMLHCKTKLASYAVTYTYYLHAVVHK